MRNSGSSSRAADDRLTTPPEAEGQQASGQGGPPGTVPEDEPVSPASGNLPTGAAGAPPLPLTVPRTGAPRPRPTLPDRPDRPGREDERHLGQTSAEAAAASEPEALEDEPALVSGEDRREEPAPAIDLEPDPEGQCTTAPRTAPPRSPRAKQLVMALLCLCSTHRIATYLVAGFGELPSFEGIDNLLGEAQSAYEKRRPKAQGPSGDILAAIANNMNNSRLYGSDNKMVAISVSRTFGVNSPNGFPYFCWDSFLSALLSSLDNPEMGRQTVRAILSGQTSEGLVPNFCHWNGESSRDRSQPPVGAMCVWKMNQRWPDVDFLREVYPNLALWHAWWMKARNAKNDGLLEWGSGTGTLESAQDETGWDDTPHFEGVTGVRMVGDTMNAYAVDLCSLWAMDAHYLELIANAIEKPEDAKRYQQEENGMNDRINATLWNEKLGIYCSRFWDKDDGTPGDFLTRLTPANFYPLISGAPDASRAQRVLAVMTDPTQFWGEWILPTVSRRDPSFLGQDYWRGTIWGPTNYLVFQGVKRYATPEVVASFAQKSVHLFMDNWLANGYCGENFLSIDGSVGGNRNYTWGALMCLIGIEAIVDIDDNGAPQMGPGYNEPVELVNLPMGGKVHRVSLGFGKPEVTITQ